MIFVRNGFFKDGKFKFDLIFPPEYPTKPPRVIFKVRIFHPLVEQRTGEVDLKVLLNEEWNYLKDNMLYSVLSNIKSMFSECSLFETHSSFNPEAAVVFQERPQLFVERSLRSVEESIDQFYQNEPGTSLIIKKYGKEELEPIREKVQ